MYLSNTFQLKTQQHTLNTFQRKHNNSVCYIIKSVYRCISLCFDKICNLPWHCIVKFLLDFQCYTKPRFTYSLPHLFFLHRNWLPISSLYSMGFMSCEFPGHFRMGIPLLSLNVLVLLELWHGGRSWIKMCPFCGNTMH